MFQRNHGGSQSKQAFEILWIKQTPVRSPAKSSQDDAERTDTAWGKKGCKDEKSPVDEKELAFTPSLLSNCSPKLVLTNEAAGRQEQTTDGFRLAKSFVCGLRCHEREVCPNLPMSGAHLCCGEGTSSPRLHRGRSTGTLASKEMGRLHCNGDGVLCDENSPGWGCWCVCWHSFCPV